MKSETEALACHFDELQARPFLAGVNGVRTSLAGGHKKTALTVLNDAGQPKLGLPDPTDKLAIPKNGAPSTIIIKPENPILTGILENEAYCLYLAKLIGIDVIDFHIIESSKENALAIARYDRTQKKDGSIRRLHQEDFAQTNNILPIQKYEIGGLVNGPDLKTLLLTSDHLLPTDELKLLDRVIFSILVANTDAHAKNYAMILSAEPRLAPLYDVSSVLLWDFVNQFYAQKIAGKKLKPVYITQNHWKQLAEQSNFNPYNVVIRVQHLVDEMVAKKGEACDLVAGQKGTSKKMVSHIAELVEAHALRIAGRLKKEAMW